MGSGDDPLALVQRANARLRELEAIVAGGGDIGRVRSWAMEQFRLLTRAEQSLRSGGSTPATDAPVQPAVLELLREVASAGDDESLPVALGALTQLTGAQRGFIALLEPGGGLTFPAVREFPRVSQASPEALVSRSILRAALGGRGRSLAIDDAMTDRRFEAEPSVDRLALRAVLVVPLVADGRPFGVLYLDNPRETAAFTDARRVAAEDFAALVAPRLHAQLVRRQRREARASRLQALRDDLDFAAIAGTGDATLRLLEELGRVAKADAGVLLVGETGSGKTTAAASLHANSRRAGGAQGRLCCAGLTPGQLDTDLLGETGAPGLLERADGGTLVLDEVDELDARAQARLLQLLERGRYRPAAGGPEREADLRVVSTSRRELASLAARGEFREDLLYRLRVVQITIPPLRERPDDLDAIAEALLAGDGPGLSPGQKQARLDTSAASALRAYRWPGNIRELKNVLQRAAIMAAPERVITTRHLPPELVHGDDVEAHEAGLKEAVRAFRRRFVKRVVAQSGGDHRRAAQTLGVHPKYIYKLLRDLESP